MNINGILDEGKDILSKAAWRTASKKGTKLIKEALLTQLAEGHPIKKILMMPEYGDAITMLLMGYIIPQMSKDSRLIKLSDELKIGGVEIAMDESLMQVFGIVQSLINSDLTKILETSLPPQIAQDFVVTDTGAKVTASESK